MHLIALQNESTSRYAANLDGVTSITCGSYLLINLTSSGVLLISISLAKINSRPPVRLVKISSSATSKEIVVILKSLS